MKPSKAGGTAAAAAAQAQERRVHLSSNSSVARFLTGLTLQ